MSDLAVGWERALAWRVRRHHLDRPATDGQVAVARRLGGIHAQVMSSAELALGIRAAGVTPAAVQRAVTEERSLVKTWTLRGGTLHLVPADDLPLWVAALTPRTRHFSPSWLKYRGVTADDMEAILEAVPRALDGRALTREQLAAEVARLSGRPHLEEQVRGSWGAVLKPAAFRGLLCFGPAQGRNVTFVLPRQWLGRWREVDSGEAQAELLRRFLDAYGPATPADFARWFGSQPGPARQLVERLAGELVEVDLEGERAWVTRAGAAELAAVEPQEVVRLLPGFDPYVVGALGRLDRLLPGPLSGRVSRTSGWISPTLLVGGRLLGTWSFKRRGRRLAIRVEPFAPLPGRVREAAEAHAATLAALLDATAETSFAPPSA